MSFHKNHYIYIAVNKAHGKFCMCRYLESISCIAHAIFQLFACLGGFWQFCPNWMGISIFI